MRGEINNIMRFSDFFIGYKIGLKSLESRIPFRKLPLYRKIAVITAYICAICVILFAVIGIMTKFIAYKFIPMVTITIVIFVLIFLVVLVTSSVDSTKGNMERMLNCFYKPYSEKRIQMVRRLLEEYKVRDSYQIDMLIEEARKNRLQHDYIEPLRKPIKVLAGVVVPIIAYLLKKYFDVTGPQAQEILLMIICTLFIALFIFSIVIAFDSIVKDIFYHDYNKYNELIDDLQQVKLFYMGDMDKKAD